MDSITPRCGCGKEIALFKRECDEVRDKGKLKEVFDKHNLKVCCRMHLTAGITIKDYCPALFDVIPK